MFSRLPTKASICIHISLDSIFPYSAGLHRPMANAQDYCNKYQWAVSDPNNIKIVRAVCFKNIKQISLSKRGSLKKSVNISYRASILAPLICVYIILWKSIESQP